MSIIENANELGKMISKSSEFNLFNKSQINFMNDNNLQIEYENYKKMYNSYMKDKNEDLASKVDMQYEKLLENKNFSVYLESKEKLESLMNSVHELIDYHIDFKKEKSCCSSKKDCSGCSK